MERKDCIPFSFFKRLGTKFSAKAWHEVVSGFERDFPEPLVPTYVFSNHDRKRSITSVGNDPAKAKLLALMQMTLRGIPFTYYGEELGIPKPILPMRTGLDPLAQKYRSIPQFMVNWTGESLNRDECRTPMLWDSTANAGFTTTTKPWLPVSANYREINATKQWQDSTSLLRFYADILRLRNASDALRFGTMQIAEVRCDKDVFAYYRTMGDETFLVLLNFSKRPQSIPVSNCKVMLSTVSSPVASQLGPWEGRAVLLKGE
jgi:glycosidase